MTEPVLIVEDLVKHFPIAGGRVVQAINNVSFEIYPGETLGLVGESGSGKTTVGRCIIGLLEKTGGSIRFKGTELNRRSLHGAKVAGKVQFVFQEPNESLDPRWPVWRTIAEPLLRLRVSREEIDRHVAETMRLVGLAPELRDAYPSELTAGQQQRVGIGRAMITEPDLVVLDEPTSALDPTARADIIDLLRRIQREKNTAYLFISHDLSTIRYVSHRVAVMYLGMIVELGAAETVFADPQHPYASGLLSSVLLPHPHLKAEGRVSLAGEIPSPIDLPKGCFLAGRCPFAEERCDTTRPPRISNGPGRYVHCHRSKELAGQLKSADHFTRFMTESRRILGRRYPVNA